MFALISFLLLHGYYLLLYIGGSSSFLPPLSAKEEAECFKKMHEGDDKARDTLIERNLRLIAHIIKKYYSSYKDQEDLISIGTIGLIKAIKTFNPDKGARFATYAARCIENAIHSLQLLYILSQNTQRMQAN